MSSFYMNQRKKLNILIDDENKPVGGKWSFDVENRKKLPKKITIPKVLIHDYDVLSLKNNTEKINIVDIEEIEKGLKQKSKEFKEQGSKIYREI